MTVLRKRQDQQGFTLVELMISLLIGTILLAGLISLFLSTRQTQDTREQLNQVANDARSFTQFLAHDIRMAGYQSGACSFTEPALTWDQSSQTLTIRYCQADNTPFHLIQYNFTQDSDGQNVVNYEDDHSSDPNSGSPQPLLSGITLEHIWFGEAGPNGLQFFDTLGTSFSKLRDVRIVFKLDGNASPNSVATTDQIAPVFDFTVAIRNNTLDPLQVSTPAANSSTN